MKYSSWPEAWIKRMGSILFMIITKARKVEMTTGLFLVFKNYVREGGRQIARGIPLLLTAHGYNMVDLDG